MAKSKSLKVPDSMQAIYDEVTTISDDFCKQHLKDVIDGIYRLCGVILPYSSLLLFLFLYLLWYTILSGVD